jgi:adenylate cyclase
MSQRLDELRQQWQARGLPTIRIRIGINTDTVRVGNFGSNLRFDYTIIGDGVNLASRLEGANKQYGTETLISHSTWEQVHDQLITREIDLIQVKGRQEPTRIYELLAESSAPAEQLERIAQFDSAITLYRKQRFQEALDQFSELADVDPNDQPTRIYIERCRTLIQTPPTSAWDGVYVMTSK